MQRTFGYWGVLVALTTIGCGERDSSSFTSVEDAAAAFDSIAKQTIAASSEIDSSANGQNGATSLDCADGGTLETEITTTRDATSGDTDSTATHDFQSCAAEGSTMKGDVSQTAQMTKSGDTTTSTSKIEGTVTFSGEIEGVCDIDATITSTREGGGSPKTQISGTICGHPASDVYAALP